MTKLFIICFVLILALSPVASWAHPGPLDQYGQHQCLVFCNNWGLSTNQIHYHDIPLEPNYQRGGIVKLAVKEVYYQASINQEKVTAVSFLADSALLSQNTELDKLYCQGADVFASGLYYKDEVRVKPVCRQLEQALTSNPTITIDNLYQPIPDNSRLNATRVYHYQLGNNGQTVFTDRPEYEDLQGKLIQGKTDSKIYFVPRNNLSQEIQAVSPDKVSFYFGNDYSSQLVYVDDAIIFTYTMGQPLN